MKLHTAGSSEPHTDAPTKLGTLSSLPAMHGTIITGTSWKCSARYTADSVTRSRCSWRRSPGW
jgi:hypothetical protein